MNVDVIKEKLKQYFDRNITKEELSEWALNSFHYLLSSGEIFEIEKLVVFRFLTKLSTTNCSFEPCTDEEIHEISDILNGQINIVYTFSMKIPVRFQKTNISRIRDILLEYKEKRTLPKSELKELEAFYDNKNFHMAKTVEELLEVQIASLLFAAYAVGYDEFDDPSELVFRLMGSVFMHITDLNEVDEDEYLSKIFRYIYCCMGENHFCVRVVFEGGLYNVSILV